MRDPREQNLRRAFDVIISVTRTSHRLAGRAALALREPGAFSLLAGSVLYLLGVFLVTVVFNVPKNEALATVDPNSTEAASSWTRYVPSWTAWNHARAAAAVGAAAAFIMTLRQPCPL